MAMSPRDSPLVGQIDDNFLFISGGKTSSLLSDGIILNLNSKTVHKSI